jgi:hypothetical protein
MNSSSKTPPRFVPTLTEVVPASVDPDVAALAGAADAEGQEPLSSPGEAAPAFHSPWLADGVPVTRGGLASIPRNLPPLPDSLPPQQFLPHPGPQSEDVPEADHLPAGPQGSEAAALEIAEPAPVSAGLAARTSFDEGAAVLPASGQMSGATEEHLVQRLMRRVDQLLEQRLREAMAAMIEGQARSMALQLRQEVESAVRQSVRDAMRQELSQASMEPQGLGSAEPQK